MPFLSVKCVAVAANILFMVKSKQKIKSLDLISIHANINMITDSFVTVDKNKKRQKRFAFANDVHEESVANFITS